MSGHRVELIWKRATPDFAYETYNRSHEIRFKAGAVIIDASAAPDYKGDPDRVDPEEAFVAALSSCHMLSFLAICARKRLIVDSYEDDAIGLLENEGGKYWMTRVTLRPKVVFSPQNSPDATALAEIHHKAHETCFIANSVKTDVRVEPR